MSDGLHDAGEAPGGDYLYSSLRHKSPAAYTIGFLFDEKCSYVALIQKTKPDWQKGKFNAIGGKIEEGESPQMCMQREFGEETGVILPYSDWHHVATMRSPWHTLVVYVAATQLVWNVSTLTEERVVVVPVEKVHELVRDGRAIGNIGWLMEMARANSLKLDQCTSYGIQEHQWRGRSVNATGESPGEDR